MLKKPGKPEKSVTQELIVRRVHKYFPQLRDKQCKDERDAIVTNLHTLVNDPQNLVLPTNPEGRPVGYNKFIDALLVLHKNAEWDLSAPDMEAKEYVEAAHAHIAAERAKAKQLRKEIRNSERPDADSAIRRYSRDRRSNSYNLE